MKTGHRIPRLGDAPDSPFPDPGQTTHPDGLVAWGGDLAPQRLLNAYRQGIFPWYEQDSPILWWSPEPRAVMLPGGMCVSRRLRRTLRQQRFQISVDQHFARVIDACAAPRSGQDSTWITTEMRDAYVELHAQGHAHSIEVLDQGRLLGGLYGVAIGKVFFAESKFHRSRDASKVALAALMRCLESWDFAMVDCQIWNPHLERLGISLLSGEVFRAVLDQSLGIADQVGNWGSRAANVNLSEW